MSAPSPVAQLENTAMTQALDPAAADADRALKAKHAAMWAMGDYDAVSTEVIPSLGGVLVEATGIGTGDRVLDVAAGSGNASIPAARSGADVVASDLTPELVEIGRGRSRDRGLSIEWTVADAEALPFEDGSFDAAISLVGVMFAPHHQAAADELLRVTRSGGRIGLLSWTPEGFIGQMFVAMRPYAPPPPPGAQPPPRWGDPEHVRELFGDGVTELGTRKASLIVDGFETPEAFRDYFKRNYGPTIAVYRFIADDPDKVAALDRDLVELARRFGLDGSGSSFGWEYLIVTARRR
jgi:ubiquinone/menaquinone biosynthesis C-methylase UbiE